MKYIYPKDINLDKIFLLYRSNKIMILNKDNINIYGFLVNLKNIKIVKEYNNFKILLNEDNPLIIYDNFLMSKINNYKNIVTGDNQVRYFKFKNNEKLNEYYNSKKTEINIYINYVKKAGFLNVPIINIL